MNEMQVPNLFDLKTLSDEVFELNSCYCVSC